MFGRSSLISELIKVNFSLSSLSKISGGLGIGKYKSWGSRYIGIEV
jgi:hypothetical protein